MISPKAIVELLKRMSPELVKHEIIDIPIITRSSSDSDLTADTISFMPLVKEQYNASYIDKIFKKWSTLDSFPKYPPVRLAAADSKLLRQWTLREIELPMGTTIETVVLPNCYKNFSAALKTAKKGSFIYVGIHSSLGVSGSEPDITHLISPKLVCVILVKVG